jgi:hypothetical protein
MVVEGHKVTLRGCYIGTGTTTAGVQALKDREAKDALDDVDMLGRKRNPATPEAARARMAEAIKRETLYHWMMRRGMISH